MANKIQSVNIDGVQKWMLDGKTVDHGRYEVTRGGVKLRGILTTPPGSPPTFTFLLDEQKTSVVIDANNDLLRRMSDDEV